MTLRSLVVTHTFPFPPVGGSAMRITRTLEVLAERGPVDLVCILHAATAARLAGRDVPGIDMRGIDRLLVLPRPAAPRGTRAALARLLRSRLPSSRSADYGDLAASVGRWTRDRRYDLVWLGCGTEGDVALSGVLPVGVPVVADLDDLEDDKIAARSVAEAVAARRGGWRRRVAVGLRGVRDRVEIRRWRRLHAAMSSRVDRLLVCSDGDLDRLRALGVPNGAVVPNVYPEPPAPLGGRPVGSPPALTMIGTLDYRPNADAAEVLVREVLPGVRAEVPDATVRLVGRSGPATDALARSGAVVATGAVDDIGTELARADVVVVPIRFGGGTRIKILEAFAHRIPVVSTTAGAAGLGIVDGREALIADDMDEFASACVDVLRDEALRTRLVDAAEALWRRRYRVAASRSAIEGLIDEIAPSSESVEP